MKNCKTDRGKAIVYEANRLPINLTPMSGNIQYIGPIDKGFPEIEDTPGFSSASSCCVDGCSPGELIRGGSRGPDALWSPDSIVPVVHTGHAPGGEEILPWWYETGTGYAGDDCGTFLKTVAACNSRPGDHKPLRIPDSCGRASCPICWPVWADRAGTRVRDSLEGYMSLVYGNSQKPIPGMKLDYARARHIPLSPDRQVVEKIVNALKKKGVDGPNFEREFLKRFVKEAQKAIKLSGASGEGTGLTAGIMVVHGIRLAKDEDASRADMDHSTNRYREVLDRPDWRDHVVWYPHVHLLAYGSLDSFEEFHKNTGWRYRVLRTVDEPEAVVRYLLSHAPTVPYRKAYVPFGKMNSRYMVKVREFCCRMPVKCEECIEAGVPEEEADRVIATLAEDEYGRPCLECEHDHDLDARHRARGDRGAPVAWSFETVSNRRFTRVKRRFVYEWRSLAGPGPGPRRVPPRQHRASAARVYSELGHARVNLDSSFGSDRRVWVSEEKWDRLVELGVISSWYEGAV